jgi:hypothetical protein
MRGRQPRTPQHPRQRPRQLPQPSHASRLSLLLCITINSTVSPISACASLHIFYTCGGTLRPLGSLSVVGTGRPSWKGKAQCIARRKRPALQTLFSFTVCFKSHLKKARVSSQSKHTRVGGHGQRCGATAGGVTASSAALSNDGARGVCGSTEAHGALAL